MAKKRKPQFELPKKTVWDPKSLQTLPVDFNSSDGGKFADVINKILKKDYQLIPTNYKEGEK
jgi:hypothetical protein